MNTQNAHAPSSTYIGVDVARREVVAAVLGGGVRTLPNNPAVLTPWLATLPADTRLGLESTGSHHRTLAELAHARGLTVYVLNPKDVRHYAHALGRRGKTDRVDAETLARYIAREHALLHPWVPPTPVQERLTQLLTRRSKLVVAKGMLRASLLGLDVLNAERAAVFDQLDRLLAAIDRELTRALKALPQGARHARLRSTPGIGPLSGTALTVLFSRVTFAGSDAAIAYTGLDPRACDSGKRRGRRRLSKRGPSELRRLLYNAAMSAARTSTWKPFYERQRAKGLSSTAAFVVLARKLVRVSYALYKHDTDFDPARVTGLT